MTFIYSIDGFLILFLQLLGWKSFHRIANRPSHVHFSISATVSDISLITCTTCLFCRSLTDTTLQTLPDEIFSPLDPQMAQM